LSRLLNVLVVVITLSLFVGCTGDAGPQGEIGPQGKVGSQGEIGPQGEVGPQGDAGPQGEIGLQGLPGTDGTDGAEGPAGPTGSDGALALQGQVCPAGSAIAGFGIDGAIICVPVVIATPTPISGSPPTTQGSTGGDSQYPELKALTISPSIVAVGNSGQAIRVTLSLSDNLSGVGMLSVSIANGCDGTTGYGAGFDSSAMVSGTNLDGIWIWDRIMPRYSPAGVWIITGVTISDNAGNSRTYRPRACEGTSAETDSLKFLESLGFDVTFIVS
jgi:hypothetical protein